MHAINSWTDNGPTRYEAGPSVYSVGRIGGGDDRLTWGWNDGSQQARAAELFAGATEGRHVIVLHQQVLAEAVYVLGNLYDVAPRAVSAVLRDLTELPGVVTADELSWPAVWDLWPRRMRDFGDACLTAVAKAGTFDRLATFDTALAKRARRQGVVT